VPSAKICKSNFRAAWWLTNPHAQTLYPQLFQHRHTLELLPERLELEDGDFVDLCWNTNTDGPIVVVFHGLEGSINSPYANSIMAAIQKRGWRGVFMHFRGCSTEFNRLDRNYHSGDTADIAYLIETLRARHPDVDIFALGYSLGGNALLKYLGESSKSKVLSAAVAVSVPFLLEVGADRLSQGFSRLYQHHLISRLHKKMQAKYQNKPSALSIQDLKTLKTFRLFDDQITAPLHGFRDVDDYYQRCSSRQFLINIRTPTLIIHALDDPFMTPDSIPKESELSEQVCLELSDKGGHVGFVGGKYPFQGDYWLEQRIPEFLQHYLD
jgi:uncharacterized protein